MGKKSSVFLTIVMIFFLLAACGSNSKSSGSDDKKELIWISETPATEKDRDIFKNVIASFEKENQNVKVKWVEKKDSYALIRQQLAAGAGPDIISTGGPTFLSEYVNSGYLLPLDKYSDQYKWEDRFYDWAYKTGEVDGKLYGLPDQYEALLVWYNKDMFSENGWEIPTNFAEFTALNEKIKAKDIMPFTFGTSDVRVVNEWWLSEAYNAYLGPEDLKKVLKNEIPWTSDLVKDATKTYVDMWQNGYINDKQSHAITLDDAWTLFNNEKAAMKLEGTWALSRLLNTPPSFETDFFIMPAWREGVKDNLPIGLGDSFGINAKSDNPDLAAAFLDKLLSAERAQEALENGTFLPINDLEVDGNDRVDPFVSKVYKEMDAILKEGNAGYVSWTYFPPSVLSHLWNNIDSVLLGQMSIDDYLQKAQENAEKDADSNLLFKFSD
jgi:raffinose/stachyose/melibiose transport system substrate-binding protein